MRPRTVDIVVTMSGMTMPLATVSIQLFASILEADTALVCPKCGQIPAWHGGYDCTCCPICGKVMEQTSEGLKCAEHGIQKSVHFNHWSMLKRVVKGTGEIVTKTKFTGEKETVKAQAYIMELSDFAKYIDATCNEYGITVKDENSAKNLRKLLIATKNLQKVIFVRFKDTYEERVSVLTLSMSNRIILRELIPLNLQDIKETLRVDLNSVTPQEIEEASAFVKMLPTAKEELLNISDYRTIGITTKAESPKVVELEQIIARAKAAPVAAA